MTKILAIVQIIIVSSLIIYSTVQLFMGSFEQAVTAFPLLLLYYVLVVARQKRKQHWDDEEDI